MTNRISRLAALAAADLILIGQESGFAPGVGLALSLAASVRRDRERPLPPLAALLASLPVEDLRHGFDAAKTLADAHGSRVGWWRVVLLKTAIAAREA